MKITGFACVLSLGFLLLISGAPGRGFADTDATMAGAQHDSHFVISAHVGSVRGKTVSAIVILDIQSGWHIYASDPGDVGMPTRLWFDGRHARSLEVFWPKFREEFDKIGGKVLKSNIYEGTVAFPIVFKVSGKYDSVPLSVSFAVCGESCIPKKVSLDISPVSKELENHEILSLIEDWKTR